MKTLSRGITPDLLLSQVKNTMPYLFQSEAADTALDRLPPAVFLKHFDSLGRSSESLTHFEYFRLCLSAHFLTCGTPVPTDVDNQIRLKLWPAQLPIETALQMTDLVIESRSWDSRPVSPRHAYGAKGSEWEQEYVSGHLGEWFTVGCGAYCALLRYREPEATSKRQELFAAIEDEIDRHSAIFGTLWRAGDGLGALVCSASLAHNFGDLDRVMEMWDLPVTDPLRLRFQKLTAKPFDAEGKLRYQGRLWVAGELYKAPIQGSAMAFENHRHFALRKPRSLRRCPEFLIPNGPFFDSWGIRAARVLAAADGTPSEDTLEVIEALRHGWERLPKTVGYARALSGVLLVHPDLTLEGLSKPQRALLKISQPRFEKAWSEEAIRLMDDIPSRASP